MWSLRALPEPLRPVGTLLALDAIWTRVTDPADRWPRLVVVDEAWLLLQQPAGAQFLLRAAKAGRKHWAGLTIATQDTADVLGTELGGRWSPTPPPRSCSAKPRKPSTPSSPPSGSPTGERAFLLCADRGHALLSAGVHRVAFAAAAADAEHDLITTDPAELAAQRPRPSRATAPIPATHRRTEHDRGDGLVDVGPA